MPIIKRVTRADWTTPVVMVPKKGGLTLRVCAYYKVTVHPVLRTEHCLLPRLEVFTTLVGGKVFRALDLTSAYQQVVLSTETRPLLTVNPLMGLYEYQGLPFGIPSAAAVFQSLMDGVLKGVPKVGSVLHWRRHPPYHSHRSVGVVVDDVIV